jgi:hypothetical protein
MSWRAYQAEAALANARTRCRCARCRRWQRWSPSRPIPRAVAVIAADAGGDLPYARAEAQVIAGGFEGGAARVLAG